MLLQIVGAPSRNFLCDVIVSEVPLILAHVSAQLKPKSREILAIMLESISKMVVSVFEVHGVL
jgi:hypothetical protein